MERVKPMARQKKKVSGATSNGGAEPGWTFLTNHAHVLVCLARDPGERLRDVASQVGITERAVQKIVMELEAAGALTRTRVGRRNSYEIHRKQHLRHPVEHSKTIGELLRMAGG